MPPFNNNTMIATTDSVAAQLEALEMDDDSDDEMFGFQDMSKSELARVSAGASRRMSVSNSSSSSNSLRRSGSLSSSATKKMPLRRHRTLDLHSFARDLQKADAALVIQAMAEHDKKNLRRCNSSA